MNTREFLEEAKAWQEVANRVAEIERVDRAKQIVQERDEVVMAVRSEVKADCEIIIRSREYEVGEFCMVEVAFEGFSIYASVVKDENFGWMVYRWLSGSKDEYGEVVSMIPQENIYAAVLASAQLAGVQ